MSFQLYDKFKLTDGRIGWIIEIFDDGASIMFELDKKGLEGRIIDISATDLAEKV